MVRQVEDAEYLPTLKPSRVSVCQPVVRVQSPSRRTGIAPSGGWVALARGIARQCSWVTSPGFVGFGQSDAAVRIGEVLAEVFAVQRFDASQTTISDTQGREQIEPHGV